MIEADASSWRIARSALWWTVAWVVAVATYTLTNDQFHRLSSAWQIAHGHALPFRDYFDPGFFLAEFTSAALLRLFGDTLVPELLLNTAFVATGAWLVVRLTDRLAPSHPARLAAFTLTLLALPRAYDYDKTLFYPLGLLLVWRYAERPGRGRLIALAAGLVTAALFRYDSGVYLGAAALCGVAAVHAREPRVAARRAGVLVLLVAALSAPVLAWLQFHGGVLTAADQVITYAQREGARTRITALPGVTVPGAWVAVGPPPRLEPNVAVRWIATVDEAQRRAAAARLGLEHEAPDGPPERRTFRYALADESTSAIRAIVAAPEVDDTSGIDRATLQVEHPQSRRTRLVRAVAPLRMRLLPGAWTADNAQAVLFYVCVFLPLVAIPVGIRRWPLATEAARGQVVSLLVLCALLDAFILRNPIAARVGGIAGPLAVLGTVTFASWRPSRGRAAAGLAAAAIALAALGLALDWPRVLGDPMRDPGARLATLRRFAATPPDLDLLPKGSLGGVVGYVRRCTDPGSRIYAAWFAPELYFFAERGFAAGNVTTFGGHWSEERFQRRSAERLVAERAPLVLIEVASEAHMRANYPLLMRTIGDHYQLAATHDFGSPPGRYRVMVRNGLSATTIDQATGLPCAKLSRVVD